MKIFKDLRTGVLEIVTNEKLLGQYEKYIDIYELVDYDQTDKEATLSDLKKKAKEMGLKFDRKATKDDLLNLISTNENE